MKRRTDTMRVMIISHDRATIRALKIALGKKNGRYLGDRLGLQPGADSVSD